MMTINDDLLGVLVQQCEQINHSVRYVLYDCAFPGNKQHMIFTIPKRLKNAYMQLGRSMKIYAATIKNHCHSKFHHDRLSVRDLMDMLSNIKWLVVAVALRLRWPPEIDMDSLITSIRRTIDAINPNSTSDRVRRRRHSM